MCRLFPILLCACIGTPSAARAVERVVRVYDEQRGLAVAEISSLAQDAHGFLWVGTIGGLCRFDGRSMRVWAPDSLRHVVSVLSTDELGDVLVGGYFEPLYRVTADGVATVPGADGLPIRGWKHATLAGDGTVWVTFADSIAWRAPGGPWRFLPARTFEGEFYRLFAAAGGDAYVATSRALWRVTAAGASTRLAEIPYVRAVVPGDSGAIHTLAWQAGIHEVREHSIRSIAAAPGGASALVRRGARLYAAIGPWVIAFDPLGATPPDTIAPRPGVLAGKTLVVDREGSLWIGSFRGLVQLPEPETVTWNDGDGLPAPPHARFVLKSEEGVWTSTWFGLARLRPAIGLHARASAHEPRGRLEDANNRWRVVRDGDGRLWTGGLGGFRERRAGAWTFHAVPGESLMRVADASLGPDSAMWLSTSAGLFRLPRGERMPRVVPGRPPAAWGESWRGFWVFAAVVDRRGTAWITNGEDIAHANADSVARGLPVTWTLETPRDIEACEHLAVMPSGEIWLATGNGGMRRRAGGKWEEIPGTLTLPGRRFGTISPSPRGGVWLTSTGACLRVEERVDLPQGWRVLEDLTLWDGMPNQGGSNVLEEPDGRLWIASLAGLTEVPPSARTPIKRPPVVRLVELVVDGKRLPVDLAPRLPFRRNRLELHFAALSYRDPNLIRYEIRLREGQPWSQSRDPDFRFVDLAPGRHAAEVRASLDGVHWTDPPTRVAFTVLRPWWLEWWALTLLATLLTAALVAAYRIRVGFLLRLERQRARIAMDLHDEMGSGLGSIGLLAGLAAGDDVDDASRRNLAGQIADAAGDLGGALSDIVWSLRSDEGTLETLAMRVAERARRLFPDPTPEGSGRAEFVMNFPDTWPLVELPLEVRRNLQLVAMEALHNAARHAHALHVELGVAACEDGRWRLWVQDDGVGVPQGLLDPTGRPKAIGHPARAGAGNGLRNLVARARSIDADIAWRAVPGGGTRMEVRFAARAARSHERANMAGRRPPS